MKKKIPLFLITGFLGSGKTSFISNILACYSRKYKIAIVQNEFASSTIDSDILKSSDHVFTLRELYNGSIFCACQFSNFKNTLVDLSADEDIDIVIVEATGIADPIAVTQLLEDNRLSNVYYLNNIITIVDVPRFMKLKSVFGVRHQLEVADYILLNKIDLVDVLTVKEVIDEVSSINPFARRLKGCYGEFELDEMMTCMPSSLVSENIKGELTKCRQGNFISNVYKSSMPLQKEKVIAFLHALDSDVLRVKGYFVGENNQTYIVQYVPGQIQVLPWHETVGRNELISIGFKELDFSTLE